MKPSRVGSCGYQHHDDRFRLVGFLKTLSNPQIDFAIRWIAEYSASTPILNQSVVVLCEEVFTLVIFTTRTRIKVKVKFLIEFLKNTIWGNPLI